MYIDPLSHRKDILSLSPDNSILQHHYNDLLLDLYEKLGDSHISYCYQSNQINSQQIFSNQIDSNSILSHCYSALDCYHTVFILSLLMMNRRVILLPKKWIILQKLLKHNEL